MTFQYPQALWLLATLPLMVLMFLRWRSGAAKRMRRIGEPALVKLLIGGYSPSRAIIQFTFFSLAFILCVLALANPRTPGQSDPDIRQGIDLLLAVDVSNSMRATDIQPDRLTAARNLLQNIVKSRPDDRIGLVVFAGHAYQQLPLTYDRSAIDLFLRLLDPSMAPVQGTALGETLEQCRAAFGADNKRFKVVLLLSDGEAHDMNSSVLANEMAASGIQVHTVGFGSPEGTTIIDRETGSARLSADGSPVISKLNEGLLQELAKATRGEYFRYQGQEQTANALVERLSTVQQTAGMDPTMLSYRNWYPWLSGPAILLLLTGLFIPERKKLAA